MKDNLFALCALAIVANVLAVYSDPSQAPSICAAEKSNDILVAHEECNKFYECSDGRPVSQNCPQNLLYNPDKEYCDWPENVDCGSRSPSESQPDKEESDSETNAESDTVYDDPSKAPEICAEDNSDGILVAHEDCNKFYKCYQGEPAPLVCPGNLLYNPEKAYCDWSENVNCGNRKIGEQLDKEINTESDKVNDDPSKAPEICAEDNSDGILVAHEDCNKFYKCYQGKPAPLDCPGNLLYNPEKEYCDWSENVNCGNRKIANEQEPNTEASEVNDDPSKAPEICAKEDSDGILVAHEDCNKFYKCYQSKPAPLDCPGNLLYNPEKEYCDWPENVQCGRRV